MLEVTFFNIFRLPQGDAIAESMVFAFPDKFWDKQHGILGPFWMTVSTVVDLNRL